MPKKLCEMSLKELGDLVQRFEAELTRLNQERRNVASMLSDAQTTMIAKKTPATEASCSDHAIIRYLERAKGVDVNAIRSKILSASTINAINSGALSITVDGLKFCIRNKMVTTVLE